jgi:C-terminal processing protease CtpA/Prc
MNTNRLAQVCKLWGRIKYLHPHLAYKDIDWDAALVNALPKIMASSDAASYAKAVGEMLEVLQDPATRIEHKNTWGEAEPDAPIATSSLSEDGILLIWINLAIFWTQWDRILERFGEIATQVSKARAVIVDLRFAGDQMARSFEDEFNQSGLSKSLCPTGTLTLGQRSRLHRGFVRQNGWTSGSYDSTFVTTDRMSFPTSNDSTPGPVIFLVNQHSSLPSVALALRDAGRAAIIAEGGLSDPSAAQTVTMDLGENLTARFRTAEHVNADGTIGVTPDLILSANEPEKTLTVAYKLARDFQPYSTSRPSITFQGKHVHDSPYQEMTYPNLEYRLLALFRIWNVFEHFFPYKELMDHNWNDVLHEFIPSLIAAEDDRAYTLTLAKMLVHTQDSHVWLDSLSPILGEASAMLRVRQIEDRYVITEILDKQTTMLGFELGDILVVLDDEPIETRIAFLQSITPASTRQRQFHSMSLDLLAGPDKSRLKLRVKKASGEYKTISITRSTEAMNVLVNKPGRTEPTFKLLNDHLGFVDLTRLKQDEVNDMFEALQETRAIIFDMRGYPQGTCWAIAPRLSERSRIPAAKFRRPRVDVSNLLYDEISCESFDTFLQYLPNRTGPAYLGRTVMLIDERAISQSEHTGLFLKAANNTYFIGSSTAGANGDVTGFYVPGGGSVYFTGQAVQHPDGKQLQRVGLIPDLEVHPTIPGIREGRDEILEAAIHYLNGVLEKQ